MKRLEAVLRAIPSEQWQIDHILALDWHDGPREGVGRMRKPHCEFYFELLDERHDPDGLDDRLFLLSELSLRFVREIESIVPCLASAREDERVRAKARLEAIRSQRTPTAVVVHTRDWEHILGCWNIADKKKTAAGDWFSALGIPRAQSA